MASPFATLIEEDNLPANNEAAVPTYTKKATKFGLALFTSTDLLFLAVKLSAIEISLRNVIVLRLAKLKQIRGVTRIFQRGGHTVSK